MDFESLYTTYQEKIFRLCMGYVNDYEQARDLCQETFIKVWQNLDGFRSEASAGTWIFRIATNTCLRHMEKHKKKQQVPIPDIPAEEKQQDTARQLGLLQRFIAELPEIDRIIISLELEDVKQAEIAEITGLSPGNVRIRIHRIKEYLGKRFNEYGK